jgi:hypothetical protein
LTIESSFARNIEQQAFPFVPLGRRRAEQWRSVRSTTGMRLFG